MSGQAPWRAADSAALYGIDHWGAGYFSLADSGEVVANASFGAVQQSVSLMDIVAGLEQRGHAMPVLLRIENILDDRITRLNEAFRRAIAQLNYRGHYRGVFPIKVNQQCHVVEEITKFGGQYHHGLEAGSKAELMVALAHLRDREIGACIDELDLGVGGGLLTQVHEEEIRGTILKTLDLSGLQLCSLFDLDNG